MLLHVDCMQIPVPEEMLRKKASVTVPVLKGVQGSGTLSNVAETHDRVERGVTRPPHKEPIKARSCWDLDTRRCSRSRPHRGYEIAQG